MLPKYIIFDWDNTLVDSAFVMQEVMDKTLRTLKTYDIKIDHKPLNYWNLSLVEIINSCSVDLLNIGKNIYFECYKKNTLKNIKLYDGAFDLIHYLYHKNIKLYIISNKQGSLVRREVNFLGISKYFTKVCGSGDSNYIKPSKEIISFALDKKELIKDMFFIGDSDIDLICAQRYGCRCILIREHVNQKECKDSVWMKNLHDLLTYLKMLSDM